MNRNSYQLVPAFLNLLLFAMAATGAEPPSSLEGYLDRALTGNPGLRAAGHRYDAQRAMIPLAESFPDPRVMVTHFIESIQTRTGPQNNQVMVSQTFPWPGKRRLRGEVARKEAEAAEAEYRAKLLDVALETGMGFYDYAYLGRAMELTGRTLELTRRLEKTVEEQVRAGGELAPLLRLQVEIGKQSDALQTLEKRRRSRSTALRALFGEPDPQGGNLLAFPLLNDAGTVIEGREALIASLKERNPELAALETRIRGAESSVALARRSPFPDPTLGVGVFDTGTALVPGTPGSGDDPVAVQLGFSIPLWSGKYQAEREAAEAKAGALREQRDDRENRLLAELESALQGEEETASRVALFRDSLLPKAKQALEVTETSYRAGKAAVLDFIDSERTLLELERSYWRAVADRQISQLRIHVLTGREVR